jgi:hypothetical protein
MEDFVKSLTHVHSETDVSNQWKRAIKSLALMSDMDIAIAWLHLSKYALHIGDSKTVLEMKTIYKRALREYEHTESDETQYATNITQHNKTVLSTDLNELSKDIKDLRAMFIAFDVKRAIRAAEDRGSESTDETLSNASIRNSEPASAPQSNTPSRPHSAPAASHQNGGREGEQPGLNNMLKEMLEKCCKENRVGNEAIKAELIDTKKKTA